MLSEKRIHLEKEADMEMEVEKPSGTADDEVYELDTEDDEDDEDDKPITIPSDITAALSPEDQLRKEKQAWVNQLRLKFCVRPDFEVTKTMIFPDGTLNQAYFRPPKGFKAEEARKWTDVEKELLIKGIEKHGIGNFGLISKESLPKWSTNDLRVKCIRLIGRQNLQLYRGWKGNADDIAREYEKNKTIGLKYGTWKQGVLVYDDDGLVEKEILASKDKDDKHSAVEQNKNTLIDDDIDME